MVSNVQAWSIKNDVQNSICDGLVEDLPQGCFELDEKQQIIASEKNLPLMIESRSGTGKTNVLFQHLKNSNHKTVCFVTVSKRLCAELERRYKEVEAVGRVILPPCQFFTLNIMLNTLSTMTGQPIATCTFEQYVFSRSSRVALTIDLALLQNEIGGVISG